MCTDYELAFAAILVIFGLAAVHSTWHMNSLIKILELRHANIYSFLGQPNPHRTVESDKHSARLLFFVMSETHSALGDIELTREIKLLRISFAINLISVAALVAILFNSSNARSLITLMCWSH